MANTMQPVPANPLPFGLLCYGVSVFILSGFLWGSLEPTPVIGYAIFTGGMGMVLAALAAYRAGNTYATTLLGGYGTFWASTAFYLWFFAAHSANMTADLAWIAVAWGIFTAYMLVASLRTNLQAVQLLLGLLLVLFIFLWIAMTFHTGAWTLKIAAIAGVLSALDAWLESFREIMGTLPPVTRPAPAGRTTAQPT
ncbi:MAG TPA: acetate uptake transporter [Candidatus Limnocylindria bacterium]|jgi:succinate-acetate transporter protein|nr:acetate uptake transporter [Candidatus Limnocylindria bacterium]